MGSCVVTVVGSGVVVEVVWGLVVVVDGLLVVTGLAELVGLLVVDNNSISSKSTFPIED